MPGKRTGEENLGELSTAIHHMILQVSLTHYSSNMTNCTGSGRWDFYSNCITGGKRGVNGKKGRCNYRYAIDEAVEKAELDKLYVKCQKCQELV